MRQAARGCRIVTALAALLPLALAGCAQPHPPAPNLAASAKSARTGTILSARAVLLNTAGVRSSVLAAIGVRPQGGLGVAPAIEYIVRQQDGTVISVIEPASAGLHPGERVRILPGPAAHIAPLAPRS